jgi:hypothetical protein
MGLASRERTHTVIPSRDTAIAVLKIGGSPAKYTRLFILVLSEDAGRLQQYAFDELLRANSELASMLFTFYYKRYIVSCKEESIATTRI